MRILIVDDDKDLNKGIQTFLNSNNITTESAFNGREGLDKCLNSHFNLILSDLQMPEMNGMELMVQLKEKKIDIPIIIMTAFSSIENAVEAMRSGAEDYLTKPINLKELLIKINKIFTNRELLIENEQLKKKIAKYEIRDIIGESEAVLDLKEMLRRISSDSDIPVTIYGKSGTGKELVARNIHYMSERSKFTFMPINCAVLSEELMESELFGHKKGSFTGALQNKVGIIEECEGGTIFLDEISEMSPRVQSKLLRVLQDGVIQQVGSNEQKKVNVRFISASNQKLSELVEIKKIREDLYFRLNVIEVEVPSLRARRSDIPILVSHFLQKYNNREFFFRNDVIEMLLNYDWPGNIRELENLIRMLLVTVNKSEITMEDLPKRIVEKVKVDEILEENSEHDYKTAYNRSIIAFEKSYLKYHLKKNNYNISRTAESINLSRVSLHKKINEYSLDN